MNILSQLIQQVGAGKPAADSKENHLPLAEAGEGGNSFAHLLRGLLNMDSSAQKTHTTPVRSTDAEVSAEDGPSGIIGEQPMSAANIAPEPAEPDQVVDTSGTGDEALISSPPVMTEEDSKNLVLPGFRSSQEQGEQVSSGKVLPKPVEHNPARGERQSSGTITDAAEDSVQVKSTMSADNSPVSSTGGAFDIIREGTVHNNITSTVGSQSEEAGSIQGQLSVKPVVQPVSLTSAGKVVAFQEQAPETNTPAGNMQPTSSLRPDSGTGNGNALKFGAGSAVTPLVGAQKEVVAATGGQQSQPRQFIGESVMVSQATSEEVTSQEQAMPETAKVMNTRTGEEKVKQTDVKFSSVAQSAGQVSAAPESPAPKPSSAGQVSAAPESPAPKPSSAGQVSAAPESPAPKPSSAGQVSAAPESPAPKPSSAGQDKAAPSVPVAAGKGGAAPEPAPSSLALAGKNVAGSHKEEISAAVELDPSESSEAAETGERKVGMMMQKEAGQEPGTNEEGKSLMKNMETGVGSLSKAGERREFSVQVARHLRQQTGGRQSGPSGEWKQHRFILEDGKTVNVAARHADGTLQLQIGTGNSELNKVIQQHINEIRQHLQEQMDVEIDLQLQDSESGQAEQESEEKSAGGETGDSSSLFPGGESESVQEMNTRTIRYLGFNNNEWTA